MSFLDDLASAVNQPLASLQAVQKQDSFSSPQHMIQVGLDRLSHYPAFDTTTRSQRDVETLALVTSWTYSAIQLVSRRLSARKADMFVKRQEGEAKVDINNHPFEQLLRNPVPGFIAEKYLRYYTWQWWLLRGEAYIFISTPSPGEGEPEELWPIPADMIQPEPKTLRRARGEMRRLVVDYTWYPDPHADDGIRIPGENILHFRFPNVRDFWRGLSPLSAGKLPIETDHAQAEWLRTWYEDENARPAFVASVPETLSDREYEVAREEFYRKFAKGHGTAFTRSGDLKIDTVAFSLRDQELYAGRRLGKDEIDAIFGIPAGLTGESMSGDSRQAAETLFAENTIQPLLDLEAAFWTTFLTQPYFGSEIIVEAANIVPRDRSLAVAEFNSYQGTRTTFENRAQLNLPELDAPETLEKIIRLVPTGLIDPLTKLGILTSIVEGDFGDGNLPPDMSNRGEIPQTPTPSLPDQAAPEQVLATEIARTSPLADLLTLPSPDAVVSEAISTELGRWRKVALRLLDQHNDPLHRTFESDIIPPSVHEHIEAKLGGARSERAVKDIFGEWLDKYDSRVSYNGHKSEADVLEAAAKNIREAESVSYPPTV